VAALVVQLLNGMRVEVDGTVLEVGPPRAKGLLAYLLMHGVTVHARGDLACLLWPTLDEPRARTNLRQTLHRLRQALPGSAGLLEVDAHHVAWHSDVIIDLDVRRFETAIANADGASEAGDEQDERALLETAVRYYRGDLLPESSEPWIHEERVRLRQLYSAALERLMVLLETNDAYAGVLRHERGSAPRPAMRALPEQLRCFDSGATALPTGDAAHGVVPFVGRHAELAELGEAWQAADAGAPAFVLVRGEPGIGKSRLVEELLRGLRDGGPATALIRCHDGAGALSYAPVSALLAHPALARHRQRLAAGDRTPAAGVGGGRR